MNANLQVAGLLDAICFAWFGAILMGGEPPRPAPPPVASSRPIYRPIPGECIGVVSTEAEALLAAEGRSAPPGAATFSFNGGSPRLFYIAVNGGSIGKTLTFLSQTDRKTLVRIPHLILATAQTLRCFHIPEPYSLVSVKVNGGAGSGPESSFAASDPKVLDETPEYPLRLNDVIPRLKSREVERLGDPKVLFERARAARAELPPSAPTGGEIESTQQIIVDPTWLSRPEQLRVKILFRFTEGEYRYGHGIEAQPPDGVVRPDSPRKGEGIRYGVEYGVELGAMYDVSKAGDILSRHEIKSRHFARVLEPPG